LGKRAMTFSDSSRLTCYANDYGWENAYAQFFKEFADTTTLAILISSSGESNNIINAAKAADMFGCKKISLTGFSPTNTLLAATKWDLAFHVASYDYGVVECVHQIILHTIC